MSDQLEIETIDSKLVYRSPWMRVWEDKVRFADGSPGFFNVVEAHNGVVIVAKDAEGRLQLVQQYRYAIKRRTWEFPMGGANNAEAETAIDVARRELAEETGKIAAEVRSLGKVVTAGVVMRQHNEVFFATGLSDGQQTLERAETGLVTRSAAVSDVEAMIRNGEICDAPTISAFALARLNGLI